MCERGALELLADQITHTEQRYPDSFIVILGDLTKLISHANCLNTDSTTCPTRDSNILDHCYTVLKDAYHSVPRAALGLSDHCLVHLLPAYRQKLKSSKPILRTVRDGLLKQSRIYKPASNLRIGVFLRLQLLIWMNSLTPWHPTLVSVRTCVYLPGLINIQQRQTLVQYKTQTASPGQRGRLQEWGKSLVQTGQYTLNREIRVAKKNYAGKLKKQLSSNDPTSVWKGLKAITSYKTLPPALRPINNWLKTWTVFTVGFKNKSLVWHPTPTLTIPQHSHHTLTLPLPYCFSACNQDLWRRCKQSLQETED